MHELTERQAAILEFIRQTVADTGRPPSSREICHRFGFKSPRAATIHLNALERKGVLRRIPNQARNLMLTQPPRGIPIVGRVAAGSPILAVENHDGYLTVPADFGPDEGLFAVRVQGMSMRDAGILDGDLAVVRQSPVVDSGRIAVAYLEGEATVKRFVRTARGYRLEPANPDFSPIVVEDNTSDFRLAGPMVGLVRRME